MSSWESCCIGHNKGCQTNQLEVDQIWLLSDCEALFFCYQQNNRTQLIDIFDMYLAPYIYIWYIISYITIPQPINGLSFKVEWMIDGYCLWNNPIPKMRIIWIILSCHEMYYTTMAILYIFMAEWLHTHWPGTLSSLMSSVLLNHFWFICLIVV